MRIESRWNPTNRRRGEPSSRNCSIRCRVLIRNSLFAIASDSIYGQQTMYTHTHTHIIHRDNIVLNSRTNTGSQVHNRGIRDKAGKRAGGRGIIGDADILTARGEERVRHNASNSGYFSASQPSTFPDQVRTRYCTVERLVIILPRLKRSR